MTPPIRRRQCLFAATSAALLSLTPAAAGGQTDLSGVPVPTPRGTLRQAPRSVEIPIPSPRPPAPEATQDSAGLPVPERACRAALTALGATFEEQGPVREQDGCRIPHPVLVKNISATLALEPEALLNCTTALAFARFLNGKAQKIAARHFDAEIVSVRHASAYVCRPRNGTATLSEHALGNALDIASFTLSDGTAVPVQAHEDSARAAFLKDIRRAACGPFKTVLGPGSDADHAHHFHFDMKARRNGSAYCE